MRWLIGVALAAGCTSSGSDPATGMPSGTGTVNVAFAF